MSYTALYRKFRPDNFDDVKGQDHIVTTLKNQIKAGRIGHAYLFTGTRGTGKTTVAKILAKAVNCEHTTDGSPCGECEICRNISQGASMNVIEIDAASNNGVDNIREIVEEVSYSPAEGKFKVYIIDEVHMLSIGAFNALLKTLEEPPSYVIFILATTEVHKIPITILSRCQRYDFRRISIDTIADRMRQLMDVEQVDIEEKALRFVAKMADGSLRDGLSLLDQCIAFHLGEKLTYDKVLDVLGAVDTGVFSRLLRSILDQDVLGCVDLLEEILMQGRELTQFVTDFTWYLRNLMLAKASDDVEDVIDISSENLAKLKDEAEMVEMDQVIRYIRVFSELSGQIRYATQKRVLIEIALIKLCKPAMEIKDDSLLDRIRAVEDRLEQGAFVTAPVTGGAPVEPKAPVVRPVYTKALSEEVRAAVSKWAAICADAPNPMKTYLRGAHPSVNESGRLLLVFEDGVASDYFMKEESNREALTHLIEAFIEREIEIEFKVAENRRAIEQNFPDLSGLLNIPVEEEE